MKYIFRIGVVTCIVALLSVHTVAAVSSGGLGGRPANPDPDNPRTQSIFIYTLEQGATERDQVLVLNNSDTTQTVQLYAVDGVTSNTGAYTCRQQGEAKTGIGGWITFAKQEVVLEPKNSEEVDFTVAMPDHADVGEHNACIVFQSTQEKGEVTGNLRVKTRQAIRLAATVPGDLHREVTIDSFEATVNGSGVAAAVTLKNKGNVSADVDTRVFIKTLFGGTVHNPAGEGGSYPVLANQHLELPFTIPYKPFLGGWYYVEAVAEYDSRAGSFGMDESSQLTTQTQRQLVFSMPHPVVFVLLVLLILGLAGWLFWRIRQKRQANAMPTHTVRKGETLEDISRQYKTNWKYIARVNAIRPPYALKAGDTVKIPSTRQTRKK